MGDRIRLTISVTPETHAVFQRMAEAGGMSLGKCMGDWLEDTAEGAEFVALKMVEARQAPKTVMREFQAMAHGLVAAVDESVELARDAMRRERMAGASGARQALGTARVPPKPPSSPTGVKNHKRKGRA